jgi:HK97 family phage major capsid protein
MDANQHADSMRTQMRALAVRGEAILNAARDAGRDLTAEERRQSDELVSQFTALKARRDQYLAIAADDDVMDDLMARGGTIPGAQPVKSRGTATVSVGREARTYNRENDPQGKQFISDVAKQFLSNDIGANERLARHAREESVERPGLSERSSTGVGTGAMAGLTVPQYLLDMVAPAVANLRPTLDAANRHELPASGMSLNISRITTATSAALQTAEFQQVSFTDADDTLLTIPVLTAAGEQLISRQALERAVGVEDLLMQDLVSRVYTVQDNTLLNGVTDGMNAVANYSAYTDASPTGPELYPLIVGAQSQSATAVRGFGRPDVAIMHPRRWYWLQSQMVSTWPMFGSPGSGVDPRNAGVTNNQPLLVNFAGRLPSGLDVIADANVSTDSAGDASNWDAVYVGPRSEIHFWEDSGAPLFIRAEQPSVATLGVNLVCYCYFATTLKRYVNAFQGVRGTGMVAPAGF